LKQRQAEEENTMAYLQQRSLDSSEGGCSLSDVVVDKV